MPCLLCSSSTLLFRKASYLAILSLIGTRLILFKVSLAPTASKLNNNSFEMLRISFEKLVHLDYDSINVYLVYSSFFWSIT